MREDHISVCIRVPASAILEEMAGSDVKYCKLACKISLRRTKIYYSDDSAVQNNINDDLMKIIEGDWD
jgi:hypothetical protein